MKLPLLPSGDQLPLPYRWIRAHGLRGVSPWHFDYDDEELIANWRKLYQQYTGKDAWPFAAYQHMFNTAAFPLQDGRTDGSVIVVDMDLFDTWGETLPGGTLQKFDSFSDWLESATSESQEWISEENLVDILERFEESPQEPER